MKTRISSIIFTVILLSLGFYCFWAGWTQIRVTPGNYGIAITKTGGINEKTILPGVFDWKPEGLIPFNLEIISFGIDPLKKSIQANGDLPSGNVYASFLEGSKTEFSFTFDIEIMLHISPETLPFIVKNHGVKTQNQLDEYLSQATASAAIYVREEILLKTMTEAKNFSILLSGDFPVDLIQKRLTPSFPGVKLDKVELKTVKIPDLVLYEAARKQYEDFLATKRSIIDPQLKTTMESKIKDDYRIEVLEKYGKLLEKYPILIKLLVIEADLSPEKLKMIESLQ